MSVALGKKSKFLMTVFVFRLEECEDALRATEYENERVLSDSQDKLRVAVVSVFVVEGLKLITISLLDVCSLETNVMCLATFATLECIVGHDCYVGCSSIGQGASGK